MKSIRKFSALILAAAFACVSHSATPPSLATAVKSETLPSGVVVEHLSVGNGAQPKATDNVKVHYRGTLANGVEFDSSYKRGQPISFPLQGVIPCWTEGVQKVKVGGKVKLTCPAATAYGRNSPSPLIPPNSDLTFEVELLGIN